MERRRGPRGSHTLLSTGMEYPRDGGIERFHGGFATQLVHRGWGEPHRTGRARPPVTSPRWRMQEPFFEGAVPATPAQEPRWTQARLHAEACTVRLALPPVHFLVFRLSGPYFLLGGGKNDQEPLRGNKTGWGDSVGAYPPLSIGVLALSRPRWVLGFPNKFREGFSQQSYL